MIAVGAAPADALARRRSSSTGILSAPAVGGPATTARRSAHAVICFWYVSSTPVADMITTMAATKTATTTWHQNRTERNSFKKVGVWNAAVRQNARTQFNRMR